MSTSRYVNTAVVGTLKRKGVSGRNGGDRLQPKKHAERPISKINRAF